MPEAVPFVLHPLPTPCRGCGTILQATYAEDADFCCPVCLRPVCYTCGCVEEHACTAAVATAGGAHEPTLTCSWELPGCCSFCAWRASYEFYQEATGRQADDPFYVTLAPSVRAVKGLGYGIGGAA
jgi:hypothetical protein